MSTSRPHLLLVLVAFLPSCGGAPELQGRYQLDGADFARTVTKFLNVESQFPAGGRRAVWLILKREATYDLELYDDGTFRAVQDFDVISRVSDLPHLLEYMKSAKRGRHGNGANAGGDKGVDTRVSLRGRWRNQGLGQIELEQTHVGDRADMDFVTASYMAGTLTLPVEVNGDPLTLRLNRRGNAGPPSSKRGR